MSFVDNVRICPATEADASLPRIPTKEEAVASIRAPSGLMKHVIEHSDGTFSVRSHTWRDRCEHCVKN